MIDSFTGDYDWLSNFYQSPMVVPTLGVAKTLEHAYQAMKAANASDKEWVMKAATPTEAKKRGRVVGLRVDWELVKVPIMHDLLGLKFFFDTKLSCKLLSTGEAELVEGNTWGDTFWGVCKGEGQNMLGKLLVMRRTILHGKEY